MFYSNKLVEFLYPCCFHYKSFLELHFILNQAKPLL